MQKALLFLALFTVNFLSAQDLTGYWFGLLETAGIKLEINLHVKADDDDAYSVEWVIPFQGADLPIPEFYLKGVYSDVIDLQVPGVGYKL